MLRKKTMEDFVNVVASDAQTPGGGGVSANIGANGVALLIMVCDITLSNKKYKEVEDRILALRKELEVGKEALLDLIEEDAKVFSDLMQSYKMPKETEEQRQKRENVLQEKLKLAGETPMKISDISFGFYDIAKELVEIGNPNVITDAAIGTLALKTAILGGFYNVKINLKSIKDTEYVAKMREKMEKMESIMTKKESEILKEIEIKL